MVLDYYQVIQGLPAGLYRFKATVYTALSSASVAAAYPGGAAVATVSLMPLMIL